MLAVLIYSHMRSFLYKISLLFVITGCFVSLATAQNKIVVFQSDFGLKDGAVSAMKGVAMEVSPDLKLYDLTHEIPSYNIWEGAFRLYQTVTYWPKGTVFVSVVDPGVGTDRKSVVLKTKSGHFIVTPDNGTLTLVAESLGIEAVREIDEAVNRRKNSGQSYTFHGRDVYAYTAARLASGTITFEQVGKTLPDSVVTIPFQKAIREGSLIKGNIPILDVQYGNVWTNIPSELFNQLNLQYGDTLQVSIYHKGKRVYKGKMPYTATFGAVKTGKPLAYMNSLLQLSFALNMGNFASTNKVGSGNEWSVEVKK
jgi:S-adenosylmethionine hydrolase